MFSIPLYRAEIEDGLSDIIRLENRVSIAGLAEPELNPKPYTEEFKQLLKAQSSNIDEALDLYPMKSLMVSAGPNQNLDVFLREELWNARATPEDKPLNLDHNSTKVIGHITACNAINDDGSEIEKNAPLDDVPDSFHIMASSVIYKHSEDEEWQKTINSAIGEIVAGKRYVSMEALFANFDYILYPASAKWNEIDKAKIVERNKETSFLTKHIKAFGGNGVYENYKIGRVLRNFFFSGLAVVLQPANPKSIIFDKNNKPLSKVKANSIQIFKSLGYLKNSGTSENEMPETNMIDTNKITELTSKLEKAEAALREQAEKQWEKKVSELEALMAKASEDNIKLVSDNKILTETIKVKADENDALSKDLTAKVEEVTKKLVDAETELNKTVAEKQLNERVNVIKTLYKVEDENAKAIANTFVKLSDEEFKAHAEMMAKIPAGTGAAPATDAGGEKVVGGPKIPLTGSTGTPQVASAKILDEVEAPKEAALAATATDATQSINEKVAKLFKKKTKTQAKK